MARGEESIVREITTITRIGFRGGKVLDARRRSRDRIPRKSRSGGGAGSRAATSSAAGGTRSTVDRPSQVGLVASVGAIARARCSEPDKQCRVRKKENMGNR
jgi:ribosome assembly protein YihI (activator of Der GTPase)